jgi:tetratricopeptide (TPR) repeat protein
LLGALHISLYRLAEFREALSIAKRSRDVAKRLMDPTASSLADWMIGTTLHLLGDQVEAERLCKTALIPAAMSTRMAMVHFGFDPRIRAVVILARALWLVGRSDEALTIAAQLLREASSAAEAVTVASAFVWTSSIFLWCGDLDAAEDIVEKLVAYAARHSLGPYHDAVSVGLKGEIAVRRGDANTGVVLLQSSIAGLRAENQQMLQTVFATALAEGLGMLGQYAAALVTIEQAIEATARNGGSFDLPEMLRVKGQLLAVMPNPDVAEAERCFLQALEIAKGQGAIGWELRGQAAPFGAVAIA